MSFTLGADLRGDLLAWIQTIELTHVIQTDCMREDLRTIADKKWSSWTEFGQELISITCVWEAQAMVAGIREAPLSQLLNKRIRQILVNDLRSALHRWLDSVAEMGIDVGLLKKEVDRVGLISFSSFDELRVELDAMKESLGKALGLICEDPSLAEIIAMRVQGLIAWDEYQRRGAVVYSTVNSPQIDDSFLLVEDVDPVAIMGEMRRVVSLLEENDTLTHSSNVFVQARKSLLLDYLVRLREQLGEGLPKECEVVFLTSEKVFIPAYIQKYFVDQSCSVEKLKVWLDSVFHAGADIKQMESQLNCFSKEIFSSKPRMIVSLMNMMSIWEKNIASFGFEATGLRDIVHSSFNEAAVVQEYPLTTTSTTTCATTTTTTTTTTTSREDDTEQLFQDVSRELSFVRGQLLMIGGLREKDPVISLRRGFLREYERNLYDLIRNK